MRVTTSNMSVLEFTVASTTGKDDKKKTSWFNVVCFGKTAENASASIQKGDTVVIVGRLEQDEFTKKDGTKGKSIKLIADEVAMSCRWNAWVKDRTGQVIRNVKDTLGAEEMF
jgi:single-strand DNA-binding protein